MRAKYLFAAIILFCLMQPGWSRTLTLYEQPRGGIPVVYELPEDANKNQAVTYIKSIRDMFFKQGELIDAKKTEPEVLRDKLKNGFVLYSVFGKESPLLRQTMRPLPFNWQGNSVTVGGKKFSGDKFRFIFVGKNPYSDIFCSVYAASTNEMIFNINNRFTGPRSYHLFDGEKQLDEGDYNENFILSKKDRLSVEEALADVREFFKNAEEIHPNLLAKMSVDRYLELKDRTAEEVKRKLDNQGEITVPDLAYILYYRAAAFEDGHTRIEYNSLPHKIIRAARFPPFLIEFRDGRYWITAAETSNLENMELVAMNNIPFSRFIKPIIERCSGEIIPYKAEQFTHSLNSQRFWWAFSGIIPSTGTILITTTGRAGNRIDTSLNTVDVTTFERLSKHQADSPQSTNTQIAYLDDGNIAYFNYTNFIQTDSEKKAIDGIFQDIKKKGVRKLLIDLRRNGGGNSNIGEFILSYLTTKRIRPFSKMQIKLSRVAMDQKTKAIPGYNEKFRSLEGMLVNVNFDEKKLEKPDAFFNGNAYLLIGNWVFSSAVCFTSMFRDYECGEIIGSETGGVVATFGEIAKLELTNSAIPYSISIKKFEGPHPKPGDDEHGILPDIPVTAEKLEKFKDQKDPVLAFAIDHIHNKAGK